MKKLKVNKMITGVYYTRKRILQFPNMTDYISDQDIFDLFLGLLNLIKKTAELRVETKYIDEINHLKKELELSKFTK